MEIYSSAAYPRLLDWLRIYVRFYLGLTVFGYGIIKVIKSQFPMPDLDRLIQPVGHLSPMGLLWTFMGFSPAYCAFTGIAECVGGLLLFWRRTTTLGALVVAGVMANVVMLNFCYDVPVKLFSTHLLLMALFLLAPDVRLLVEFFVLHRATTPKPLAMPFENRWLNRSATVFKIAFLGWTLGYATYDAMSFVAFQHPAPPALYGLYEVDSFALGDDRQPHPAEEKRWKRVAITREGRLAVQFADETLQRHLLKEFPEEGKIELVPRWEQEKKSTLSYRTDADDRLILDGDFFGQNVQVTLHRLPDPRYLLLDRGFHWINEKPYNR